MTELSATDDDGDDAARLSAAQMDDGDLVVYERRGEGGPNGAWIRVDPESCIDLTEAE
jgi:hypothetical protein